MGHTNVAVYNEGLPEWVKRGYAAELKKVYPVVDIPLVSAAELKGWMDAKRDVFVLDLRDETDVAAGRIADSVNIDLELLDTQLSKVPTSKKIVLIDLHGKQGQIAGRFLRSKGYGDVVRVDGGFVSGWLKAGYPFVK